MDEFVDVCSGMVPEPGDPVMQRLKRASEGRSRVCMSECMQLCVCACISVAALVYCNC